MRNGAIFTELNQIEGACKTYKSSLGEYPPDFSGLDPGGYSNAISGPNGPGQALVLQHLNKAFPHYQPGISTNGAKTGFAGFLADVATGWQVDFSKVSDTTSMFLSPASALTFWLGGQPNWRLDGNGNAITPTSSSWDPTHPVRGFLGFSANPLNPFDGGSSHIGPFFPFDPQRLNGLWYWPRQADGSKRSATPATPACPIVYFRAENTDYTVERACIQREHEQQHQYEGDLQPNGRPIGGLPGDRHPYVRDYLSTSTTVYTWVNNDSIQILSSGQDMKYGTLNLGGNPLTSSGPLVSRAELDRAHDVPAANLRQRHKLQRRRHDGRLEVTGENVSNRRPLA